MDTEKNNGKTGKNVNAVSRRWLLGVSGAAVLAAAGCGTGDGDGGGKKDAAKETDGLKGMKAQQDRPGSAEGPLGVLGANFNEDPADIDKARLDAAGASWIRGFVLMDEIKEGTDPLEQVAIKRLLRMHEQGLGTVLSLKFQFNKEHRSVPSPTGPRMKTELEAVDEVLKAVLDKVDIITIGNEPLLETKPEERATRMNPFYQKVAAHTIAVREKRFPKGCRTRLYMGALNDLDDPKKRTAAVREWIKFVNRTPELEGVDIHPHVRSPQDATKAVDFVLGELDKKKKFLVTEFSLIKLYADQMPRRLPRKFVDRYKDEIGFLTPRTKLWELLRYSKDHRLTQKQWDDLLRLSPWFENNKHFMRDQVRAYRRTGRLAVATYGVQQAHAMVDHIKETSQPWLLNSLYSVFTVRHEGGRLPRNYTVFEDFRALQGQQDRP